MGAAEREVRDRAGDTLQEIQHLDIRPLFSGFGFYVDGVLTAAAWKGRFQLRHHRDGRWSYEPVPDELVDDPARLVPLVRERAAELAKDPMARPRPRRRPGAPHSYG